MKLFVSGEPSDYNACLNFMTDHLSGYAEGYRKAADHLMRRLARDPMEIDYLIYPLMFLYRQHLELRFKELTRAGHRFAKSGKDFTPHHLLSELWRDARSALEAFVQPPSPEELDYIDEIVRDFVAVDKSSMAFRYSEDRKGEKSLNMLYHINIKRFSDAIDPALETLERMSYAFDDYFDANS